MLSTLDEIRDKLVKALNPDSIVLFGSRARADAGDDSDVDLLIVHDGVGRPVERRAAVEKLLAERTLALDLFVYTPREMRDLYQAGSPFIEEIVETGKVLYMRKTTEVWVREAEEELESARILQEHGHHRGAAFHSQQCVEKCLEAMIIESGERPERSHDLLALASHARRLGHDLRIPVDEAVFLNSVYKGRYPSEEGLLPHGDPTAPDGDRALRAAGDTLRATKLALT